MRWLAAVVAGAALLAGGCGDVEEQSSTVTGVDSLNLIASSTQLPSSGTSDVTITAIARNANNQAVEGESIAFQSSSGLLQVSQGTTDASGQATATLSPGGNPANRIITVTASAGSTQATIEVEVSGTTLNLNGPSSLVSGDTGTWTVTLQDSNGDGISGETIEVSSDQGNALSSPTLTTGPSGQVQFDLTASGTTDDTITANGAGLTATSEVRISGQDFRFTSPDAGEEVNINTNKNVAIHWENESGTAQSSKTITFSTTRGGFAGQASTTAITDGSGDASATISSTDAGKAIITATGPSGTPSAQRSIEFVATTASTLALQADPSTIAPNETSEFTAVVRDSSGNPVKNKNVIFNLSDTTGGQLTTGSATTDSQGRATTTYAAGPSTSAKDGVTVTAEVANTSVRDTASLTVAKQALRITIGSGSKLEDPTEQQYAKTFVILVTDSNGNAIEGATVNLSLTATEYYKGQWILIDTSNPPDGTADAWGQRVDTDADGTGDTTPIKTCANEDTDLDGVLDTGEDTDGDGNLEPGNPAGVSPGTVTTDSNGLAQVDVVYPQSEGGWSKVKLEATVDVAGSEGTATTMYELGVLASEITDTDTSMPGGSDGPYGIRDDCTDPR
jgi:hypothetical protein